MSDYNEITAIHKMLDFTWKSALVPRIVIKKFPEEIKNIGNQKKIRLFIRILLPLILLENEKIEKEHDLAASIAAKEIWDNNDIKIIKSISIKYRIISKDESIFDLSETEKDHIRFFIDHRIRPIPAPIALGMAALESGWGTSRFVFEGNNIFGHVSKDPAKGLKPKNWSGNKRHIKKFNSIQDSISAYMLNLNRNPAYRNFRKLRREYPDNFIKLSEGFKNYSIIKKEYIERLKLVIKKYGLYKTSNSKLDKIDAQPLITKIRQGYIN